METKGEYDFSKAEGRRKPRGEAPFVRECHRALRNLAESSALSRPRCAAQLDSGGALLPLELGARFGLLEQFRVIAHLAACTERVAPSRLEPQGGPARCSSGLEETAEHAFYYSKRICPFWDQVGDSMARTEPKQLVLLDVGYVVDNVLPPFQGEKCVVFLAILALARMVIWTTRKERLYDDANFSYRDLILFFRHQLRVKIRCDRKRLDRITFDKRWVNAASLVLRKGAMLESSFPPLSAHGVCGPGPSGPHPE